MGDLAEIVEDGMLIKGGQGQRYELIPQEEEGTGELEVPLI